MDVLITVLIGVIAFVIGGFVVHTLERRKRESLKSDAEKLKISLEKEQEMSREKEAYYQKTEKEMEDKFRSISAKIARENSEQFVTLARETLARQQAASVSELEKKEISFKTLVDPMKEMLTGVKDRMDGIEKNYEKTFTEVKDHFKFLKEDQENLRKETANLVKALRLPQVRGRWGEFQLRKVVEMAGMVAYVDFIEQVSVDGEEGRLRPDMIVNLPGNKTIVIDAKTPLMDYMEAIEADDESTRKAYMIRHGKIVRDHVKKLSSKAYWDQFEDSPEFVILFLPSDAIYQGALEVDPELIEMGISHNVLLATPMTLISLLKSVGYGWNQEALAENAKKISLLGKELYDRLCVFVDHMEGVKKGLERSVDSYNKAVGSFESRVLSSSRKLKELGISSEKELGELDFVEKIPKDIKES